MSLTHATLTQEHGNYFIYTTREELIPVPALPFEALFTQLEQLRIDSLWVHPDTDLSKGVDRSLISSISERYFDYYCSYSEERERKPAFLRMKRKGDKRAFNRYISFPAHRQWKVARQGDRGKWYLPGAYHLNTTLDYLETETGVPVVWSPSHMGIELLRDEHLSKHEQIEPLSLTLRKEYDHFTREGMYRIQWRKLQRSGLPGLSAEDKRCLYIICLDKNGQYIGACTSVSLGSGDFVRVPGNAYHEKSMGFWKYRIRDVSNSPLNGYEYPCMLDVRKDVASTNLIKAARYIGVDVEIQEGIVWQSGKSYLKDFARGIWQHRINLRDASKYEDEIARVNAEGTVKIIGNGMIGRFNDTKSQQYAMYHHPDWNRAIIHQAIASQSYTINALAKKGVSVVLVCKDSFYVLSDTPNPLEALPSLADKLDPDKLSGFKVKGVTKLTPEIIDAFSDRSINVMDIDAMLSRAMRKGEDE